MAMRSFLTAMVFLSALVALLPQWAAAEAVGRLTLVEGRVDRLKGGQLPAVQVKQGDEVEKGDVLRTKSLSKAQITFVDNTTLTISPESRIAIEEYMVDAAKGQRNALLQVFQGMVLAVVSKIYQTEKPDFVVKTHTAIMGIRGTEVGIRLAPNDTTFLNFEGKTQVGNVFPEVGDSKFKGAEKVAYAFGPATVMLGPMQGTVVAMNVTPAVPFNLVEEDRKSFKRNFDILPLSMGRGGGSGSGGGAVCTAGTATTQASCGPSSNVTSSSGGGGGSVADSGGLSNSWAPAGFTTGTQVIIIPPVVTITAPPIENYSFTLQYAGTYVLNGQAPSPYVAANITSASLGSVKTGSYPGNFSNFTASFAIPASADIGTFNRYGTGDFSAVGTTTVSGQAGGALSGTMKLTAVLGSGLTPNLTFNSVPVTVQPNGSLATSQPNSGTINQGPVSGTASLNLTQQPK
jgi:hypothetical protein